jgi:hypothetical protein
MNTLNIPLENSLKLRRFDLLHGTYLVHTSVPDILFAFLYLYCKYVAGYLGITQGHEIIVSIRENQEYWI